MTKNVNTKQTKTTIINPDEKQVKYWRDRAEKNFLSGEKQGLQVAKELQTNYKRCIKEIETKINLFYGKYASKEGMTLEEAKQLLNRRELKEFKSYINEHIKLAKQQNLSDTEIKQLKILKAKAKISRLQELQTNIKLELDNLTQQSQDKIEEFLKNTYEDGYYKTMYDVDKFKGFSSSFSGLNDLAVEKAISTKYLGANYSQRLWQNENNLMTTLNQEIPRGLTLGYNPRKLADLVSTKLGTNYNNTVRLIRTEYNHILNDATYQGYIEAGIDRYEILATLDSRTSDICQSMDGTIVPIKEKEVGVNYPPFHPNCRTTTVPYFEDNLEEGQFVFNDKINNKLPLNISYKQWKEGLRKSKNDNIIYKGGE